MAAPGTAYDDPELGADPQVGHMDDYIETSDDNGGVHLNSGIPNKAFQLAAVAIGGTAIEGAGRVWYDALVGGDVSEDADFATFAAATVAAAGQHADAVREAWAQVGSCRPRVSCAGTPAAGRRRSGSSAAADSSAGPSRPRSTSTTTCAGSSAEASLSSTAAVTERPMPDMYVYTFTVDDGEPVRVPEHRLTPARPSSPGGSIAVGSAGRDVRRTAAATSLRVTNRHPPGQ